MATISENTRKRRFERLTQKALKDAEAIHSFFYPTNGNDVVVNLHNARSRREDAIRMAVLQMSLAIEDLLGDLIARPFFAQIKVRPRTPAIVREYQKLLESGGIGFDAKLTLARILRFITNRERNQLDKLKALRNRCAHNWRLDIVHKRAKKTKPSKRLLEFEGHNLFDSQSLDHFMKVYSRIYLKLFMKI